MRRILHVDMDAFYASVEQRDNPDAARPAGRRRRRARTSAASSPPPATRRATFGVRSAIPMARAVRLCPSLVIVRPDFTKYRAVSQQVFELFRRVTPLVEPLSLDEAYLDVTENAWGETLGMTRRAAAEGGDPRRDGADRVGRRRAEQVPREDRVRLAEAGRPDGDRARARRDVPAGAAGRRAVGRRPGHRAEAARARHREARRRAHRRSRSCCATRSARSPSGCSSSRAASTTGRSSSEHEPKSSGSENTFAHDLTDLERDPRARSTAMARDAAAWLVRHELYARTVTIKVRYHDFTTITRSHTRRADARRRRASSRRAVALLDKTEAGRTPGAPARRQRAQPLRLAVSRRASRSPAAVRRVAQPAAGSRRRLRGCQLQRRCCLRSMHRGDDADEEIEPHRVAFLQSRHHRLRPDARDAHLAVGLVG